MRTIVWTLFFAVCLVAGGLHAYTPAETNELVRGALIHAMTFKPDRFVPRVLNENEDPNTWQGFLGGDDVEHGWTLTQKKEAFYNYLTTLGTTDWQNKSSVERRLVRTALFQCARLNYTNSFQSVKDLALNPNGVQRRKAIELALGFGPVDDEMTAFVETIMTNANGYVIDERATACCGYAQNLLDRSFTNDVQNARRDRAVKMLYRHRYLDLLGTVPLDSLFSACFSGYGMSSNRLEFANYVLGHPECSDGDREEFTAITNQLLSSSQPLRQLNIDDGGNE